MGQILTVTSVNGDVSNWNVSNVEYMVHMFEVSPFSGDISRWDLKPTSLEETIFLSGMSLEDYHQHCTQRRQLKEIASQSLPSSQKTKRYDAF